MTDEELIALADRLAQLGDSGWLVDSEADDCTNAAAAIRYLVGERRSEIGGFDPPANL